MTSSLSCRTRIPWRVNLPWPVLLFALFAGVVVALFGALVFGLIGLFLFGIRPTGVTLLELIGQSVPVLPALWGILALCPPRGRLAAKLGLRPLKWADLGVAVAVCIVVVLIGGILTEYWQYLLDLTGIRYAEKQSLLVSFAASSWWEIAVAGLMVTVAVPIGEEIFFRRILFGLLRPLGAWKSILLTSLIFSLAHIFLLGIPALFVMGLCFQFAYLFRRNLSSAILAHGLVNVCALAGALLEPYLTSGAVMWL